MLATLYPDEPIPELLLKSDGIRKSTFKDTQKYKIFSSKSRCKDKLFQ